MTDTVEARIKLDSSWKEQLLEEFDKPYMQQLRIHAANGARDVGCGSPGELIVKA